MYAIPSLFSRLSGPVDPLNKSWVDSEQDIEEEEEALVEGKDMVTSAWNDLPAVKDGVVEV